jgi:hypothetical protein
MKVAQKDGLTKELFLTVAARFSGAGFTLWVPEGKKLVTLTQGYLVELTPGFTIGQVAKGSLTVAALKGRT